MWCCPGRPRNDNGKEMVLGLGDINLCHDGVGLGTENRSDRDLMLMALILNSLTLENR